MEYAISIERMEEVIAPGILESIGNAIGSFFQGFMDGLANGVIF